MVFFCCKQKTAYEMLMSDWSSDVCSSDLALLPRTAVREFARHIGEGLRALQDPRQRRFRPRLGLRGRIRIGRVGGEENVCALIKVLTAEAPKIVLVRSDKSRVGKECVSTFRSRWALCH